MLYYLIYHLNLDFGISNQLGMVTIITPHFKGFKLIFFNELYISYLNKPLVNRSTIFSFDFT